MEIARSMIVALACGGAITTCGGSVSTSPCEGAVTSTAITATPPFDIAFGSAIHDSGHLSLFFTRDGNACPTTWYTYQGEVPHRTIALLLVVVPETPDGFIQQYTIDDSGSFNSMPDVFSGYVSPNSEFDLNNWKPKTAGGTLTISRFIDGVEVAGTVSAQFDASTTVSFDFDIPFCTAQCSAH